MRTSAIVTISLPSRLARASEQAAKRRHITRSELMRTALRNYLEEQAALETIRIYEIERGGKKLKSSVRLPN